MARYNYGGIAGEIRGSVSGMTYGKWRGLGVVRKKSKPVRRLRTTQPANRARIGYLSREWGYLTEAQREAWRIWAANHPQPDGFGGTFSMSGQNAFVQLSIRSMMSQAAIIPVDDAPVADLNVGMATLVASDGVADGQIKLDWTELGTGDAGDKLEVGVAGPFTSPGVFDSAGHFAVLTYVAGNLNTYNATGLMVEAWYWFRVRYVKSDGQASAYLTVQWQAPDVA